MGGEVIFEVITAYTFSEVSKAIGPSDSRTYKILCRIKI